MTWKLTFAEREYQELFEQLFRPDRDEHAAFLYAGLHETGNGSRLLVRRVVPIADSDFGASTRGSYRAVSARAIARAARKCDEEGLCLLWAHSHPGAGNHVDFSPDDLASHRRVHPHLMDLTNGRPVAGLVLGQDSLAGDVWSNEGPPARLESTRVIGRQIRDLRPRPPKATPAVAQRFARQALLFGADGQAILRTLTVAVIGAGGGGSLIVQSLAHLGVGRIVVIDFDHVGTSNLSRLVGARPADAERMRPKIDVVEEMVRRIDPAIAVDAIDGDITYVEDARRAASADFAFLATDTTFARYAFNALVHQYLVPGIQVGAKVSADPTTGQIDLVHVMERPLLLDGACLECSGAISAERLRREQLSPNERTAQDYVGASSEAPVADPSVITLNSISTALATTDFLFAFTGLLAPEMKTNQCVYYPEERILRQRPATRNAGCRWCDPDADYAAYGAGDLTRLPLRAGSRPRTLLARDEPSALRRLQVRLRGRLGQRRRHE